MLRVSGSGRDTDSEVMCLRYSPDRHLLAAGFADGFIRVGGYFQFRFAQTVTFALGSWLLCLKT